MKRLSVLVAASNPSVRNAIGQALGTRNYTVVHYEVDRDLGRSHTESPHQMCLIAPDDSEEAFEAVSAYHSLINGTSTKVILCLPDELRDRYKELSKIVVSASDGAEGPCDREAVLDALDKATRHLMTILVADDEPLIRRMFSMYFKNEGYQVVTAQDGAEAIEKVREVLPDLVITDIQMPRADGYEVCRSIKESRETQHIPVVIVSALGGELDIDKGFHAGTNEYVTKPVDLNELSGRVQGIFRGIAHRGREQVLVVTASQIERSILEYGLTQQGFEVVAANTGEQALEMILRQPPSVMVCDLKIPGMALAAMRGKLREAKRTRDIPLVVLTSVSTKLDRKTREEVKAAAFITKPFPIERLVVQIERILGERRSNLEVEREILLQAIFALIKALEKRDSYTRGHSEKVARYTKMIAEKLFSSEEEIKRYELSAQLHDVGKIGIKDSVLLKPGRLTDEEMREVQKHPMLGVEILEPIQSLQDILPGVRWHHERIDGRGYPDGLPGGEIPLMARVIGVADTFDALTSDRPYRKGFSVEKAMGIITEVAGQQLDADLVNIWETIVANPAFPLNRAAKLRASA